MFLGEYNTLIISDIPLTNMHSISSKVAAFIKKCSMLDDMKAMVGNNACNVFEAMNRNEVKVLYPGLEDIVDLLLDNGIPFSMDGDVDLLDHNDMVIATAGLLLRESKIAIDPVDDDSVVKFKAAGYRVVDSTSFNLSMIK